MTTKDFIKQNISGINLPRKKKKRFKNLLLKHAKNFDLENCDIFVVHYKPYRLTGF